MQLFQKQASRVLSRKLAARRQCRLTPHVSQSHVQMSTAATQEDEALLDWQQLGYAAVAAQHTSLCYLGWENLDAILKSKNMQLLGTGTTYFTRWYVADGCIDLSQMVETAVLGPNNRQRHKESISNASASNGSSNFNGSTNVSSNYGRSGNVDSRDTKDHGDSSRDVSGGDGNAGRSNWSDSKLRVLLDRLDVPPPTMQRFIHLRGVAWSATDTDSRRVWQQLGRVWPRPFVPELTHPPGILVAHDGVASMADELYPQLEELIASSPYPITFVGHSLGGALAKLLLMHTRLKTNRSPESLSCLTFGSPPVLAHRDGGGGGRVLQLLGLDKTQCRNFVHEDDPVPRAMLTVDPAYRALIGLSPVKNLLELRQRFLGQGLPLSLERFLFENVGEVVLLRSGAEGGLSVSLLDEIDEAKLDISFRKILSAPVQAMKLWLDHHYISYNQELEVAALLALRNRAQEIGFKL